jgi:hypothetical protein
VNNFSVIGSSGDDDYEKKHSQDITIDLLSNRLSGSIHFTLSTLNHGTLSILAGNIFACDYSGQDLPQQDSGAGTYSCGTNLLNILLFAWLTIVVLKTLLVDLLSLYNCRNHGEHKQAVGRQEWFWWMSVMTGGRASSVSSQGNHVKQKHILKLCPDLAALLKFIDHLGFCLVLCSLVAVILVVVYTVVCLFYSSYTYKYAFIVSAVFLT